MNAEKKGKTEKTEETGETEEKFELSVTVVKINKSCGEGTKRQ